MNYYGRYYEITTELLNIEVYMFNKLSGHKLNGLFSKLTCESKANSFE